MADKSETTDFRFAVLRVEREVNAQLGGSAEIAELVELMLSMGWTPPYRVYARVSTPWEGKPAVVINEGGDMQVGYSIWSREEADRVISELTAARDAAWPT